MSESAKTEWFNACYEQYFDLLLVRGRGYVGWDPVVRRELEDCIIETFEMAWERYDELRNHPCMAGWLTVVLYKKIDNLRGKSATKSARRSVSIDAETTGEIEDKETTRRMETFFDREEDRALLARIVGLLSRTEKEIFDSYFVQSRPAKDIMQGTGYSVGRIRAAIRRIRKKARRAQKENRNTQ